MKADHAENTIFLHFLTINYNNEDHHRNQFGLPLINQI